MGGSLANWVESAGWRVGAIFAHDELQHLTCFKVITPLFESAGFGCPGVMITRIDGSRVVSEFFTLKDEVTKKPVVLVIMFPLVSSVTRKYSKL
ncbi:MAG: hypothetical protein JAZ12_00770 [Candidatus Thiodiazotropha taylori]|nr:hypothetical protein [Candidatus Thiodiazotropha taylori]